MQGDIENIMERIKYQRMTSGIREISAEKMEMQAAIFE
jgi:hypothetical protein